MSQKAQELSANAIVGIDIDYETVGVQGSMLMVSASGTAVTVKKSFSNTSIRTAEKITASCRP